VASFGDPVVLWAMATSAAKSSLDDFVRHCWRSRKRWTTTS
jgi:hypothetical protein